MPVTRNKTVEEVVVFTLEDVPEEYSFLINDAVVTIVNDVIESVAIHIDDKTIAATDTSCIEWLKIVASLANGLLEELEKENLELDDLDVAQHAHYERMKKSVRSY